MKPSVSAGSRDTNRYRSGDHDEVAVAHATALLAAGRTVMVQPYLAEVDTHGETAMFFFGGVFSHAVRKGPLLTPGDGAGQRRLQAGDDRAARPVRGRARGRRAGAGRPRPGVARRAREQLVYARVDLVPGADGSPTLLELELAEPSMFLVYDGTGGTESAQRFAAAIRRR